MLILKNMIFTLYPMFIFQIYDFIYVLKCLNYKLLILTICSILKKVKKILSSFHNVRIQIFIIFPYILFVFDRKI